VHLPPAGHLDERAAFEALRKFAEVVVYDDGADCDFAPGVADRLAAEGLRVRVLDGGWSGWQSAGGPAQSGACAACAGGEASSSP
jgi:3-mercaptopyruvate sulfurtransferase SseA